MTHSFQEGDKVIFYQDTMTDKWLNSVDEMIFHLRHETVLKVTNIEHDGIRCYADGDMAHWKYHPDDLKLAADMRTEDEIYLDNLLKGAK